MGHVVGIGVDVDGITVGMVVDVATTVGVAVGVGVGVTGRGVLVAVGSSVSVGSCAGDVHVETNMPHKTSRKKTAKIEARISWMNALQLRDLI